MKLGFASGALIAALVFAVPAWGAIGFLQPEELQNLSWLPPTPALEGAVDVSDMAVYFGTRSLALGPRGQEAKADDVFDPPDVAPRFGAALGVSLTPSNAKIILDTIHLAQVDLGNLVAPVKKNLPEGRTRPYVRFPDLPVCPHAEDEANWHLATTGSYPSTHAATGMLWALIMSQLAPDRTDAVFAKGYQFGESRLVCGFHYPSDLAAGRLAASVLFAKLQQNKAFQDQMAAARAQMDTLLGRGTTHTAALVRKGERIEAVRSLPILQQVP